MGSQDSYPQDSDRGGLDFEDLVNRYYGSLYRFAMSLSRSESEAGDLVQQTFLSWGAKGHQLQDHAKVRGWLFTTLHRSFLASRRRSSRFPELEISEALSELPAVEPDLARQLDGQALVQLLDRVDPQFQAAVSLFYLEDYSYPEIASILEVPAGTVKSRISRGIAQLRSLIAERGQGRSTSQEATP